jgi:Tol biopolymer transport system component
MRNWLHAAIVLLAAAPGYLGAPPINAAETPAGSPVDPGRPLLVMNADGSGVRVLVSMSDYNACGSPDWSRDGTKIAFDAWRRSSGAGIGDAHVFVTSADGASPKELGPGAMPSWSPRGKRITFSSYRPDHGVCIMNADGSERQLLDPTGWGSEWSPRGRVIAYVVHRGGANVCVYDLIEGDRRMLLDTNYAHIHQGMAWSPDGKWICFKANLPDGGHEVAIVHVKGQQKGFKVLCNRRVRPALSWRPDGKQILVSMGVTDNDPHRRLCLLDATGKQPPARLPGQPWDRDNGDMAWSPDGKKIVFASLEVELPRGQR